MNQTYYRGMRAEEYTSQQMGAMAEIYAAKSKYLPTPIYNVAGYGAKGDFVNDDTASIQKALNDARKTGGIVFFPPGNYLITSPLVVWARTIIEGSGRNATTITKTNSTTYTGASGIEKNAVFYMDYSSDGYNYYSRISDIGIVGTQGSVHGIFLGKSAICTFENINIRSVVTGFSSVSSYMINFTQCRVLLAKGYAFDFSTPEEKTTFNFNNCYAEGCGGGWNLRALMYSSLTACGCDWCNYGGNPSDPFGGSAGGNYQTISYVYNVSACSGLVLNGCGVENSNAAYLYSESSFITFNGCYVTNLQNYVPDPSPNIYAVIRLAGASKSVVRLNTCHFQDIQNMVAPVFNIRGISIDDGSLQQIIMDRFIALTNFESGSQNNDYVGRNAIYFTKRRGLVVDPRVNYAVAPSELPFSLYNAGAFTPGSLSYVVDSGTQKRSIRFDGTGSSATAGATLDNYWRYMLDRTNLAQKRVRMVIQGTYSTGGFGDPVIRLAMSDTFSTTGTTIATVPLSGGVINYDEYITMPSTVNALLYLDFRIVFMGSSLTISVYQLEVLE